MVDILIMKVQQVLLDPWVVDECGASLDRIPNDEVFLDYSRGYSATLNSSCSESASSISDGDNFHYLLPKLYIQMNKLVCNA